MKQKMSKWELLFVVGLMLVLVVGLWGTSGTGLSLGSQVLAGNASQVTTAGGNASSNIPATETGTGKVMPGIPPPIAGQVAFWIDATTVYGDNGLWWDNGNKRLGIGTTTPQRPLHLVGNVCQFERTDADSAGFIIKRTATNRWVLGVNDLAASGQGFVISTYPEGAPMSTPRMLVTTDGNVGIGTGTTSPTHRLQVETASGEAIYASAGGSYASVYGTNSSGNYGTLGDDNNGVYGESSTVIGSGVYGVGTASNGIGVTGVSATGNGVAGFVGSGTRMYYTPKAVYGRDTDSNNYGYLGDSSYGVYGESSTAAPGSGVCGIGNGANGMGVKGTSTTGSGVAGFYGSGLIYYYNGAGVYGRNTDLTTWGYLGAMYGAYGRYGQTGPYGYLGDSDYGVGGWSNTSRGVYGRSESGEGVYGSSNTGWAGWFDGKLMVDGSIATAFDTKSVATYTVGKYDSVIAVSAASNDVTITLPAASGCEGRVYTIKRVDDLSGGHSASVARTEPDLIDSATSYSLDAQWKYVTVVSNGVDRWLIVANGP